MQSRIIAAMAGALLLLGAVPSQANGLPGLTRALSEAPAVDAIREGRPALAPFGQVRFCMQNPDECKIGSGPSEISLDGEMRRKLNEINRRVNRSVVAVNDDAADDVWSVNVQRGDCEDYALTKRDRLIAAGLPSRALRLAVAVTGSGEGHAVLVVKTDQGDLVLDNRTSKIKNWRKTDLTWIKIQSGENPLIWHSI